MLADTEREGHLPAFNAMFADIGLPVEWSDDDYARLVSVGGGKERLKTLLTPRFVSDNALPTGTEDQARLVANWHDRKSAVYRGLIESGQIPPRPGIPRLIRQAAEEGWQLAVASTSASASVHAVLERVAGQHLAALFAVFAGDIVRNKKPAPDIYNLARAALGADPETTLVIEDSGIGVAAASAAGLTTVVTASTYTRHDDFSGSALVLTSLGDSGEPARVISDPFSVEPGPEVQLADLSLVLQRAGVDAQGKVGK
ncbi:HAD-IA family hydrolase [Microbacterium sp. LWS13-1.2]|uniref:HAD-IA family hydrolase n=1 Tax=Microbacterium sp. LWS13-1.2 TaxID=3135264 RepID=A0AAU6SAK8_9MICO